MLGIICGLESEMALVRGMGNSRAACAAARPELARVKARELIGQGATSLLSFGLAGGLKQGLPVGAVVIATSVQTLNGNWDCDAEWVVNLKRLLPEAYYGKTFGSDKIISDTAHKFELYKKFDCLIADMESQRVAEVAREANIPFAVLRAVTDTAEMCLPSAALVQLLDDGRIDISKILLNILFHPRQIPELIRLGKNTGMALKNLNNAVKILSVS